MDLLKQIAQVVGGAVLSIAHFVIAVETRNVIAWVVGLIVGYYAVRASRTAIRVNNLKKQLLEEQIEKLRKNN